MSLTLSRKPGEAITVTVNGERVVVALRRISGKRAKLTVYAAPHVKVRRTELEEADAASDPPGSIEETQDIELPDAGVPVAEAATDVQSGPGPVYLGYDVTAEPESDAA